MTIVPHHRQTSLLLFASGLALSVSGVSVEAATDYGVLALYDIREPEKFKSAPASFERAAARLGCSIARQGRIGGKRGSLSMPTPNWFVMLRCGGPVLRKSATRAVFRTLDRGARRVAILEGETIAPTVARRGGAPVKGRAYILKLSHYNNADPDARERDLAAIDRDVRKRPLRYHNEAFIAVSHAIGMATPDEVVVLYYDSPGQGGVFRKRNPAIMKMIGRFNKRHITRFVYLRGVAER